MEGGKEGDGATDEMIPFASHENARPEPEEEEDDSRAPRFVALSRLASGKPRIGSKTYSNSFTLIPSIAIHGIKQ